MYKILYSQYCQNNFWLDDRCKLPDLHEKVYLYSLVLFNNTLMDKILAKL